MIKIELNLSDIDYAALVTKLLPYISKGKGSAALGLCSNLVNVFSEDKKESIAVKLADEHSSDIKKSLEDLSQKQGVNLKIRSINFKKI